MRNLTAAQMRQAEARAVERGTSYQQLMENAGTEAAGILTARFPKRPEILFLCGKGNNGGDALVMARLLAGQGWPVAVSFLCGEQLSELAALNRSLLPQAVREVPPAQLHEATIQAGVLVDAVFGIGFHGTLPENIRAVFRAANQSGAIRASLDLPSGLNCDTGEASPDTFCAALTLTFGAYKPALAMDSCRALCGEIICLDIGL